MDNRNQRALGAFIYWLLHHDGGAFSNAKCNAADRVCDLSDAQTGGRSPRVEYWPAASAMYLRLCAAHGTEPEAATFTV